MSLNNLLQDLVAGAVSQQAGGQSAGGLGSILGSVLGGATQNQAGGGALGGVLGSVLGGLTGGQQQAQPAGGGQAQILMLVLPLILNWVQRQGGLQQALSSLTQSGLGDHVQSWVSTGANMPVEPAQLANIFPQDTVNQLAQTAGVNSQDVYGTIAHVLPQVVNAVTANGQVAGNGAEDQIQQVLGALGGLMR